MGSILDVPERVATRFNLTMVALAAAAASLLFAPLANAASHEQMRFKRVQAENCGPAGCIVASGIIGPDAAREFRAFLQREAIQPGALVMLDSAGGNLLQGLKLGLHIRRGGLSTVVQRYDETRGAFIQGGDCASACAYAFLGGSRRYVPLGGRVGVHQFSFPSTPVLRSDTSEIQHLVATLVSYLAAVDASPELVLQALRTPPDRMRWLSPQELSLFRVVTDSSADEHGPLKEQIQSERGAVSRTALGLSQDES